jgi:hypothetical protein
MKTMATILFLVVLLSATVSQAGEGTPKEQVTALYNQIRSERAGTAFQDFFRGSMVEATKEKQVKALDTQAKSVLEIYGKPAALEIIDEKTVSDSLTRIRWLTKHKNDSPIFWTALFYKRQGKWEPLSVNLYDEPSKIGI